MIQTVFNGMLAILLAKFCLNDLPHAAGLTEPDYDRPATIAQLRYIAGLRQRLKMTITYERQVVTFGEAGRMIRELEAEERDRKRLKSGNPKTVSVELRQFSPTEPDLYGIVYEGFPGVGTVSTRVFKDSLIVTQLAVDEPGIVTKGFVVSLSHALEEIAKQKQLSAVKVEYLPQHKRMYELAGFAQSYEGGEHGIVVKRVSPEPTGTCYEDARRFVIKQEEGELVHGTVLMGERRVGHAWVELPTGYIWEPQMDKYYSPETFQQLAIPIEEHRYTVEEAAIIAVRTGNQGPWTDEERAKWLRR